MIESSKLGDRHLLPIAGLNDDPITKEAFVRIVVPPTWAASRAGQLLTSCLVNQLCRQAKLVRLVEVVAPEATPLILMPDGSSAGAFPALLSNIAIWAVDGTIRVTTTETDTVADYTVFVGVPPTDAYSGYPIVAIGDAWRAWVGDPENAPKAIMPKSRCPIGPFLAAALAAGEIYKGSRGLRRGRMLESDGYSLWSGKSSDDWGDLDPGPATAGRVLPPTHVFGAGAVGNALAYIAANLELEDGYFVIVDDDAYDVTNLNRCLVAGHKDFEQPKVDAISRVLTATGIGHFPFSGTVKAYAADARPGLRTDVAAQVDDLHFEVVVSCVDKAGARQDIQGLQPALLCGGSTLDLQAKANVYGTGPHSACLRCFNEPEPDGEKIRAFEQQLRKMPAEVRRHFLIGRGLDPVSIQAYLDGVQCGGLGETAVRDFATRQQSDFSVGFVSLTSGLLLAATLLQRTTFAAEAPLRREMTTLNFLNGGFMDARLAVDDTCHRHSKNERLPSSYGT
jgi:hypothetical protein